MRSTLFYHLFNIFKTIPKSKNYVFLSDKYFLTHIVHFYWVLMYPDVEDFYPENNRFENILESIFVTTRRTSSKKLADDDVRSSL